MLAKTIVTIPTYNEKENIKKLIHEILDLHIDDLDILVVDDASPDGTGRIVHAIKKENPRVFLIEKDKKYGLGTAYITAFKHALKNGYSFIITMDADFSHNPKRIPEFLQAMEEADLAVGSRYIENGGIKNWSLYRRILSLSANLVTKAAMQTGIRDCTSGFRCYRREVIESFDLDKIFSQGYSCLVEFLFKAKEKGYRIKEIPILFVDRKHGESKISKKEIYKGMFTVLKIAWMQYLIKRQ